MKFSKLQATGNDFILVDVRDVEQDWESLARAMCQYHFGVGSDGLILVQDSQVADLRMRIFNPDGSEAEICGNGLRCFAKYVNEHNVIHKANLAIETSSGIRNVKACISGNQINKAEVNMGIPEFRPEQIPVRFVIASEAKQSPMLDYSLEVNGEKLNLTLLSMGNPHAVSFVSQPVSSFPLDELGPLVENHPVFPKRINFEIARILSRERIEARVWERGVGETLACGSGACAIVVAAQLLGGVDSQVDIILPGGVLTISWDGTGEVLLAGPVEEVFDGEWIKGGSNEISQTT